MLVAGAALIGDMGAGPAASHAEREAPVRGDQAGVVEEDQAEPADSSAAGCR